MPRLVFLNKGQIIANTLKSISSQSAQNYCNYFQQTGDFSTLLTRCVCPGKVHTWDAFFYIVAQFVGGLLGLLLVVPFAREAIAHPKVNYIVTIPGSRGAVIAFLAEFIISFVLMLMVLFVTNHKRWMRFTGIFVGLLLVAYITFEAPFSGMSLNPARTVASALLAQV